MAKKTESTAVNDLINLVATQGPSVKDPGADLFSEPPKKTARMTGTVPSAGAVEPLPRTRAPAGTQQNASVNPPVRVSTAMPRANSIPPLAPLAQTMDGGRVRPALPPPRASASMPRPPIPSAAKIAVPAAEPDLDVELDDDDEADLLKTPVAQQPRAVLAPVATPAVSAPMTLDHVPGLVYPRAERTDHPNAAPDMTGASPWFESSGPADRHSIPEASHSMTENTAQVQRPRNSTVELLKKLAMPMCIAIVLGIFVGGYIVFDGQGGKKRDAQAAPVAASTDAVANTAASAEGAVADNAGTATTDEPASDEPAAADSATANGPTALAAAEPAAEPAKAEPAAEPKAEPAAVEPAKVAEPTKIAAVAPSTNDSVLGGAVHSMPAAATLPKGTKPVFVDVRIDSTPSGADVSLVDRGKTTFLGTTPINASVDPSRAYDVVFSYANKPTQIEHLDPKKTTRLAVTLGKAGNQSKDAAKVAKVEVPKAKVEAPKAEKAIAKVEPTAKFEAPKAKAEPKKTAKVADPFEDDTAALEKKLAEKKAKAEAKSTAEPKAEKAVASGEGVLMISSKPPTEIFVDGKATGLMTPQRAMKLPAGKHKITLVSPDKAHKKTIAVEITPDKPTKVIQNLLD